VSAIVFEICTLKDRKLLIYQPSLVRGYQMVKKSWR